jgi:hypothetical protein
MDILRFLKAHPCINMNALEREAGLPKRTIKLNEKNFRRIPMKHHDRVMEVLKNYGFHILRLGQYTYLPGDVVHFSIGTEMIYEARIVWDSSTFRYVFEPTGRTEWLPWLDKINTNWEYYD